jgi:hypothetical protein
MVLVSPPFPFPLDPRDIPGLLVIGVRRIFARALLTLAEVSVRHLRVLVEVED